MSGRRVIPRETVEKHLGDILDLYARIAHSPEVNVHVFSAICNHFDLDPALRDPEQIAADLREAIEIADAMVSPDSGIYPNVFWKALELTTQREYLVHRPMAVPTGKRMH